MSDVDCITNEIEHEKSDSHYECGMNAGVDALDSAFFYWKDRLCIDRFALDGVDHILGLIKARTRLLNDSNFSAAKTVNSFVGRAMKQHNYTGGSLFIEEEERMYTAYIAYIDGCNHSQVSIDSFDTFRGIMESKFIEYDEVRKKIKRAGGLMRDRELLETLTRLQQDLSFFGQK